MRKAMYFLMAVLLLTVVFVSCNKQASTEVAQTSGEKQYLFTNTPITLTVFCGFDPKAAATLKSYNEMACYPYIAEKTGISFDFIHPAAGQENERFNLMVASNEYTDIIWRGWVDYPGGPDKAIGDGIIIDLRPLVEEHAPNFLKLISEDPRVEKRDLMTDSGKMFYFTFFRLDDWIRHTEGLFFRKDWLEKMNLNAPETIDEWHSVLTALKNGNPNGTGDTIPFVGTGAGALHRFIPAYGIKRDFYIDQNDGSVKFGSMQPEYREHILEMQRWFKEGLIDPDLLTTDGTAFNAKVTGHKAASFGGFLAGNMSTFMGLMQADPNFKLIGAKWPKNDPNGVNYNPSGIAHRAVEGAGMAISTSCKYPVEAVKIHDWYYSTEGHYAINFGPEGLAYDMVNGKPILKDFILNDPNLSPVQALSKYGQNPIWYSYIQDPDGFTQILRYEGVRETADIFADSSKALTLPPVTPNYEEGTRQAALMSEIWNFVDESYADWIFNGSSLANWDAYVAEIKRMGIDEVLAIQTTALGRYNNR